jgi:D-alanyl-lipoteichoic acid acyltransferase DltB (MBOAT superfamily)
VINYFSGLFLGKIGAGKSKRMLFWSIILLDIGLLGYYKYINFIFENVNFLLDFFPSVPKIPYQEIIIPVGISYYTFQALGYIIRINRGAEKPERNFIKFTIFLTFFPKFLSGPVERSNHFLPQTAGEIKFNSDLISSGLRLFLWGLFKKTVIGNNLAAPVYLVYGDIHSYTGIPLLAVMVVQAIHIYCDFSGYTDMALGSAKILGFDLAPNFKRPFLAKNVSDFWRRWHMSLSSWCNDFIFSPFIVKCRKMGNKAAVYGVFISFFVIGIWHGANWTFVVLGILQGLAINYEFFTKRNRLRIASKLNSKMVVLASRLITFVFFSFSLIFFNSRNISEAFYFVTHLFSGIEWKLTGHGFILDQADFVFSVVVFLIIFYFEYLQEKGKDVSRIFLSKPAWVRWSGYYVMILMIYYYSGGQEVFVYMQF